MGITQIKPEEEEDDSIAEYIAGAPLNIKPQVEQRCDLRPRDTWTNGIIGSEVCDWSNSEVSDITS